MVKKKMIQLAVLAMMMAGCQAQSVSSAIMDVPDDVSVASVDETLMQEYVAMVEDMPENTSYTCLVKSMYLMHMPNDTYNSYDMDAIMEQEDRGHVHVSQNLNANGMRFVTDAYYLEDTFYYDYSGVKFKEAMSYEEMQGTLLIPLGPSLFEDYDALTINKELDEGNSVYSFAFSPSTAAKVFVDRYDFYGVNQLDFKVKDGSVRDVFDANGNFIREETVFNIDVDSNGQKVGIAFTSTVEYSRLNETSLTLKDEDIETLHAYVNYNEIDTDAIQPLTLDDDSPEDTVTATFKKRLVSRLNYEQIRENVYRTKYNENESYTVDFNNCTFEYSNYTIVYSYSWKGNVGSMGACTYDFNTEVKSSSCVDDTVEMIQKMELYLQMELYYCGLSLDDLRKESR